MAEAPPCTTDALHCVRCGMPSQLLQGALSDCCTARVTRKTTCDGRHPVYQVLPEATDTDVDQAVVPFLLNVVHSLTAVGRQPDQALDDIDRALGILRAEYKREVAAHIEATGELPG